ncbi:glycoside hydrolase family 27 [Cordyceps fumosorosea ARSEF 2679]|uniref:Alpha-galactosidase n=1 Tax=Cordyceps fumosorosea (strain ARSEF 2679) TaxID=1081104 RepID=A0A162LHG2_CORFA|nr:glycoside hydrolase family 27 [Cordyceps fumosorosea ARSEF 2679]OAA70654.1 glycoside hydrolase family 27 [Cordyceps fumosorosea ARSEF 2679]
MRHGLMNAWFCAASSVATVATATGAPEQQFLQGKGVASKEPTLGWNSWNAYHCDINAAKFLEAAEAIVDCGIRDAGYTYIDIDDCWQAEGGRVNGHIAVDKNKSPDAIDGLAKKIHDMNLKIGIYSCYEDIDAADWASWGIDYLKDVQRGVNGTCDLSPEPRLTPPGYDRRTSKSYERFRRMADALARQPREVVYSACIWGLADVYSWGREVAASWRMGADIEPGRGERQV